MPRTRLLVVGLVAGIVLATAGIAGADSGQPWILGQANSASSTTELDVPDLHADTPALELRTDANYGLKIDASRGFGAYITGAYTDGGPPALEARGGYGQIRVSDGSDHTALTVAGGNVNFATSGTVEITYPAKSAIVGVGGGDVGPTTFALATVQNNVGVWVKFATPSPFTSPTNPNTIRIVLNKAPGSSARPKTAVVGWFLIGNG